MDYKLKFLNKEVLADVRKNLRGVPPADKVVIISPKEYKSSSGLIVEQKMDALPRKGQIIQLPNHVSELYEAFKNDLNTGNIVTYGMYAGKELIMDYLGIPDQKNYIISVLSLNEIMYIEQLTKDDYES